MSLTVHKYHIVDSNWEDCEEPDYGRTLAGFESWRKDVWGSPAVSALGCTSLPQLRDQDIYCSGEALQQLLHDIERILDHLPTIAQATINDAEAISYRARNIRDAALWALENAGGVIIG
jgi:hypothetical protein